MPQALSSPKAHTIQWPFNPKTAEDLDYNFDVLEQAIRRIVATVNNGLSANDPRLSDARDPLPHAETHETGGSDPIDALDTSVLTTGILGAARGGTGVATGLTVLDATNLTTGSLPYARVQVASPRLLGRSTAGTGDMEALTVGTGLSISGGAVSLGAHASSHETGGSDPLTALSASILTSGSLPFARIQVASPRLLGRGSASTGDMEALTLATGLTISGGAVTVGSPFTRKDTVETLSAVWEMLGAGVNPPSSSTRSSGTRVTYATNAGGTEYAVGIDTLTLWWSVPATTAEFQWYHGNVSHMRLPGDGTLYLENGTGTLQLADSFAGTGAVIATDELLVKSTNSSLILKGGAGSNAVTVYTNTMSSSTMTASFLAMIGQSFQTGSTDATMATGVATTMLALTSGQIGVWFVQAYRTTSVNDPAGYHCVSFVQQDGTAAQVTALKTATWIAISVSGLNVRVTQTTGINQTITMTWMRFS